MSDEEQHRYEILRVAVVGRGEEAGAEELARIYLSRWIWSDGTSEYCLEYVDGIGGEIRDDQCFADEASAEACANAEFGLRANDWRLDMPEA